MSMLSKMTESVMGRASQLGGKRKRDTQELSGRMGQGPDSDFPHQYINEDPADHSESAVDFSALTDDASPAAAQNLRGTGGPAPYHTMTVPQPTESAFLNQNPDHNSQASDTPMQHRSAEFQPEMEFAGLKNSQNGQAPTTGDGDRDTPVKFVVGSDDWHRVRKDNHKEVERRRRETINEGINELAKIVPGCEKNKGSILQRAVQFITQLKENEQTNIEKWTLEKLLTEQAIAELSSTCDKMKNELEQWKKAGAAAGISVDKPDESD